MKREKMSGEHPNYGGVSGCADGDDAEDDTTERRHSGHRGKRTRMHKQKRSGDENNAADETKVLITIPAGIDLDDGKDRRAASSPNVLEYSHRTRTWSWGSLESVLSDIRSESTATRLSISNEAHEYEQHTPLERAFPERSFALIVTMIFELPTLFLISGGSDRLCVLIGRKKYTTLIALLPLISAISGNVGLQASTLTTRAISHRQVTTMNYYRWLTKEIMAAVYLGEHGPSSAEMRCTSICACASPEVTTCTHSMS